MFILSIAAIQRINNRVVSLRLDTKNWAIMSVYAPQTGCRKRVKDNFYLTLEKTIRSMPEGDYRPGWVIGKGSGESQCI